METKPACLILRALLHAVARGALKLLPKRDYLHRPVAVSRSQRTLVLDPGQRVNSRSYSSQTLMDPLQESFIVLQRI
eukprot:3664495-Pyramimonas_sp.AAC.1